MKSFSIPRKSSGTLFFCILCIIFFNKLCFAGDNRLKPKSNFIPPLLLNDFNSGTLSNNLGGQSGCDEEGPGVTFATLVPDEGFTKGNSGYSLRLDVDVSNLGEYSFYWIKLGKDLPDRKNAAAALDLRDYNYLSFWVKGHKDSGNVKVELHQDINNDNVFDFGKDTTSYVYANSYVNGGTVTEDWRKVSIPLDEFTPLESAVPLQRNFLTGLTKITDWSKALELVFVFENKTGYKKDTIYLDDIAFGRRPKSVLAAKEIKVLNAPLESSFKVNSKTPKECLAFLSSNVLEIKAEDIRENPFIESVRFEYTIDKGNIWKTIGTDYGTNKKTYGVEWRPDNARQLYNYDVRAVATDIKGNEAQTGILIACGVKPITDEEFLNLVQKKAFDFFIEHQNLKTGLFADTTGYGDASIASTGFGLAALCVGAERGWIDKKKAKERVGLALDTFIPRSDSEEPAAQGKYGFFYHFLNMHTGKRAGRAEISTVDTAILVAGALTAGEYFGQDIKKKAETLYQRVEWDKFLCRETGPWYNQFSMGWSPERGFLESYWDYYTDEVILLSLLAIGSPTHPVDPDVFYAWTRQKGSYGAGKPFIYTWHGSLFSYQYANVWFNFQDIVDRNGVDWFENSTQATLANRQFCIDNADKFKTYGVNSWGVTSMARPEGYTMHFGVPPTGSGEPQYDGTVSPSGPAGSIVFTPYLSLSALKYMFLTYPRLWGQYGLRDSFNLDLNWYAPTYYGIGISMVLLPVENFRSGLIWENFMKNRYAKDALIKAGFSKAKARKGA